ncbi:MAG TPA: nucleotide sugar dehydrogenase [Terriglobales bacterium]|nr:nucleotide sugar dehydrogenase [Terriglobales bacterium]
MSLKACVIGLGKLGSPLAACLAAKGLTVIGVDNDPRKVDAINHQKPPVHEPGLGELLEQTQGRLTAITDVEDAIRRTDISFIVVSTPSDPAGGFSLRYVEPVCQAIGRALAAKNDYHVVCLTSTVMPGTTGGSVREMLEKASGKRMGADFGLCYSPEFIALGSVIRDFLNPDMLLIGESDKRAGDFLQALYAQVCENKPALARMAFVNAEITKLAVNTYVTTKISYANMLARICEKLSGANVDVITSALGLDTRIGPKYLKGAVSYGGPCFPRDNLALAQLAQQLGVPPDLAQTVDRFNRAQISWLADLVQHQTEGTAGVLGLTYKAGTDVVEQAAGFLLAKELVSRGVKVLAFDPAYGTDSRGHATDGLCLAPNALDCIQKSDVVVVATSWPEFSAIDAAKWTRAGNEKPRTVIDCWRSLHFLRNLPGVHYLGLGMGEGFA